jgi:hypothetical protein
MPGVASCQAPPHHVPKFAPSKMHVWNRMTFKSKFEKAVCHPADLDKQIN